MLTTIEDTGIIVNELMINGAANPHECHDYKHQIIFNEEYESDEEYLSEKWTIDGDVPVGIEIDDTGLIYGYIAIFNDQPSCQDNNPEETLKVDGSNWENNGRFKHATFQFDFKVTRITTYLLTGVGIDPETEEEVDIEEELEEITTSNVSILAIKSNDITNLIFVKKYLEAGHELKIGNDSYFEDDLEDFVARHPGPFGQCNKK